MCLTLGDVENPLHPGCDVNLLLSSATGLRPRCGCEVGLYNPLYNADVSVEMSENFGNDAIVILQHRDEQVLCVELGMFIPSKNVLSIGHEVLCTIGVVF